MGFGRIRVLSERVMSRGFEPSVERIMAKVQATVQSQKGLLTVETLRDAQDHHKYIVLSEWKSKEDYDRWLQSPDYKKCTEHIGEVCEQPLKKTRIFAKTHDDIFLL